MSGSDTPNPGGGSPQTASNPAAADPAHLRARLDESIGALNRSAIVDIVLGALRAGLPIERLYAEVVVPALHDLGRSWQRGRAAIWQEHLVTQAMRTAVEAAYPHVLSRKSQVTPVRAAVAFFCPPEEAHDLGLRILCDLFDLRGFRTVFVGASTPVAEMVACALEEDVAAVCLSASTHFHRTVLHHAVSKLEEALPGVRVLVGGPAFPPGSEDLDEGRWAPYTVRDLDGFMTELAAAAPPFGDSSAATGGEG